MISAPAFGVWPWMLICVVFSEIACPKFNPTAWYCPSLQPHACESTEGFSLMYTQKYLLSIYYVLRNLLSENWLSNVSKRHYQRLDYEQAFIIGKSYLLIISLGDGKHC